MADGRLLTYFVILAICSTLSAGQLPKGPPYPVLEVIFEINPQNASRVLAQMINKELFDPDMSAAILLTETTLSELTSEQWTQILNKANLDLDKFTLAKMKEVVKVLKIQTTKELNMVIDAIGQEKFDKAMGTLGVNVQNLILYMWRNHDGDEKLLDHFNQANFQNWDLAMQEMGMTQQEQFLFAKEAALKNLNQVSLVNVTRLMRNLTGDDIKIPGSGLPQGKLLESAFDVLEVFLDADIFRTMIQDYNRTLTKNTTTLFTTRIKTGQYLSSKPVHDKIMQMKTQFARPYLVKRNNWKHQVENMTLNGSLVTMYSNDSEVFFPPQNPVTQMINCQYTIAPNQTTEVTSVEMTKNQISILAWPMKYIRGAPLFCDGQLVGIASGQTIDRIIFTKTGFKLVEALPKPADTPKDPVQVPPLVHHPYEPSQNNSSPVIPEGFLMKINLNVKPVKLPNLFGYLLLDAITTNKTHTNIQGLTALDLVTAYRLRALTYMNFVRMLNKVNIKPVPFEVTQTLQHFDVPLIQTYKTFSKQLTSKEEKNMLMNLNISQVEMDKILGTNDDKQFLKFVNKGNFTKGNVQKALGSGAVAESVVFEVVKDAILDRSSQLSVLQLLNFFQQYGGYESFSEMITQLGTVEYQDFYQPRFGKIFAKFLPTVENVTYLASVISPQNVLTVIGEFMNDYRTRDFITLNVHDVKGDKEEHEIVKIVDYQSGYTNGTLTPKLEAYHGMIVVTNRTVITFGGCSIILEDSSLDVEKNSVRNVSDGFEVIIMNQVVITTGAPLVCGGKLFGVCKGQIEDRVHFAGFQNPKIVDHDYQGHGNNDSTGKPGGGASGIDNLKVNFNVLVISWLVMSFVRLLV